MPGYHSQQVVIGVGNTDRGDDIAGRLVVRTLANQLPVDVEVAELDGEVTAVLDRLQSADVAILVDACRCGVPAGTVLRFDVAADSLPRDGFAVSTHGVDVANALELARALGDLPAVCIVYGIEGQDFDPGAPVSAPVAIAVRDVAQRILVEFQNLRANSRRIDA